MEPKWEAIHRVADRLTPALRRAFIDAGEKLRGRVNSEAVARALERGRATAVEFLLDASQFAEDLRPAVDVVNAAFAGGYGVAESHLADELSVHIAFDRTNEQTVRAVDRVGARMVTAITEETRQAIREVIKRAFRQGIPPRDVAKLLREMVGLTENQQMAVMNYRFHLLAQGLTGDRVARLTKVYAQKKLQERALTIARTETINASNEGQLELWRQARRDGLFDRDPVKVWIVTPDDRLCPVCRPLDGQQRRLEEPFATKYGPRQRPTLHPDVVARSDSSSSA
jgi:hypothetical protein